MNILRLSTVALTLAIAVFALGYANSVSADKPNCSGPKAGRPPECSDGGGVNSQIPVCATFHEGPSKTGPFHLGSDDPLAAYCNGVDGQVTLGGGFRLDTGLRGKGHDKMNRTVRIDVTDDNCSATAPNYSFQGFDSTTDVDLQIRPITETQFLDMKKNEVIKNISVVVSYKLADKSNAHIVIGPSPVGGFGCPEAENPQVKCKNGDPCDSWTLSGGGSKACLREDGAIVARCEVPFGIDIIPQL